MSDRTIARRYAQALYQEAQRAGRTEAVDADVDVIRASLEQSRELVRFFESPVISREKKENVVQALFGSRLQGLTLRFLTLLVEKQREKLFPAVVQAYGELRDEQLGILEAQARVAQPLSAPDEAQLQQALEQMTGKHVRLQVTHDPDLIGGIVLRVADTVYDGSVRHQLETLREQLRYGTHVTNGART